MLLSLPAIIVSMISIAGGYLVFTWGRRAMAEYKIFVNIFMVGDILANNLKPKSIDPLVPEASASP